MRNDIVSLTLIFFFRLRYVKGTFKIFYELTYPKIQKKSVKNVNFVIKGGGGLAFSVVIKSTKIDIGVPNKRQTEREVS